eukprot:jgi/Astpho2/7106/fgenesh1_pg.00109_%23_3_t
MSKTLSELGKTLPILTLNYSRYATEAIMPSNGKGLRLVYNMLQWASCNPHPDLQAQHTVTEFKDLLGMGISGLNAGRFIFHLHGVVGQKDGFVLSRQEYKSYVDKFAKHVGGVAANFSILAIGLGSGMYDEHMIKAFKEQRKVPLAQPSTEPRHTGSCWPRHAGSRWPRQPLAQTRRQLLAQTHRQLSYPGPAKQSPDTQAAVRPLAQRSTIWTSAGLGKMKYTPEIFDCDDFAVCMKVSAASSERHLSQVATCLLQMATCHRLSHTMACLQAAVSQWSYTNRDKLPKAGAAFGIYWASKPGSNHAFNFFYDKHNNIVYFEPQTGQFDGSLLEYKPYKVIY